MTMTATLPTTLADRLNPIALKELRQAVNSRYVNGLLLTTLGLLFGTLLVYVQRFGVDAGPTASLGLPLFTLLESVMFLAIGLGVPIQAGCRLGVERASGEGDLLLTTPLSPMQILWGKILSAGVVALLLAAACSPFLVICVLLRGVGVTQVAACLGLHAVAFSAAVCVALFLGALPGPPAAKTMFAGVLGLGTAAVMTLAFAIGLGLIASGFYDAFLVVPIAFVVLVVWVGAFLLLLAAGAMLSPRGLRNWEDPDFVRSERRRVDAHAARRARP